MQKYNYSIGKIHVRNAENSNIRKS